jgi:tetratricopeptide (TPR) repeat protein
MLPFVLALLALLNATGANGQPRGSEGLPEGVRAAQELVRAGKLDDALAAYRAQLKDSPDSLPVNMGLGVVLDLMGHGPEARKFFAKAIEVAPTPQAKANAHRGMAMSYAFEGDCTKAAKAEQAVFDYYVSTGDAYQQGEIADEAARVCIDAGDVDAAEKWYQTGHDAGLKEQNIKPERVALWNYRWEHAQARIAARRGQKDEAQKHVAAAKALLDSSPDMAKAQAVFYPYLLGYVAFYSGNYKTALEELQKANQNDPFIQTLMARTYEKLGQRDKALELYEKASATTAHNPPAAYARLVARKKLAK